MAKERMRLAVMPQQPPNSFKRKTSAVPARGSMAKIAVYRPKAVYM